MSIYRTQVNYKGKKSRIYSITSDDTFLKKHMQCITHRSILHIHRYLSIYIYVYILERRETIMVRRSGVIRGNVVVTTFVSSNNHSTIFR